MLFNLNNSHSPGNRISQHSTRRSRPQDTCLCFHPIIKTWGLGLSPIQALSLNQFLGARLTLPLIERKKGPPGNVPARTTAQRVQDIRLENIWSWKGKNQDRTFPLKDTERSTARCRRTQNILNLSYSCLEISTKILGIHQTKSVCGVTLFTEGRIHSSPRAHGCVTVLSRKMQI